MKPELVSLIDQIMIMSHELPPDSINDLSERISKLSDSSEADKLRDWATSPNTTVMLNVLIDLWKKIPNTTPSSLSLSLLSTKHAVDGMEKSLSLDITWTGPLAVTNPTRRTDQALYELIERSKKDLLIVSFVAYKVDQVIECLKKAEKRGVVTRIVLETSEDDDGRPTSDFVDKIYDLIPGIKMFYWPTENRQKDSRGRHGSLHAKCAVSDNESALISSANLTEYALELNIELGVLIHGGDIPKRIVSLFDQLIAGRVLTEIPRIR